MLPFQLELTKYFKVRGIDKTFTDQGSNPCPLNWQADSYPWRHQGSPKT